MPFRRLFEIQRYAIHLVRFLAAVNANTTVCSSGDPASKKALRAKRSDKKQRNCHTRGTSRVGLMTSHVVAVVQHPRVAATCLLAALCLSGTLAIGAPRNNGVEKRKVLFLATSSLVRGTWGYDEDTYLAEFVPANDNVGLLIRLIDDHPNFALPLSSDVLTSGTGTVLKVKRDRQCDIPYGAMLLRAAPGDPMAIIPERMTFRPNLNQPVDPATKLACYRVVRNQRP